MYLFICRRLVGPVLRRFYSYAHVDATALHANLRLLAVPVDRRWIAQGVEQIGSDDDGRVWVCVNASDRVVFWLELGH